MAHRQIVVAAPHVHCYVNNVLIGRVTSFEFGSSTPFREVRGIDVPYVQEFAPTTTAVSFTLGLLRTAGDGGSQGAGMTVSSPDIASIRYFTVELIDRRNDLSLFKADFCVATNESWSLAARGLMAGSVSCQGVVWGNEAA